MDFKRWRVWAVGALLVYLTFIVGLICVLMLSATLTQTRMSTILIDGVALNIWKLDSVGREWATVRTQIRRQAELLGVLENQRNSMAPGLAGAQRTFSNWKNDLEGQQRQFLSLIESVDTAVASLMRDKGYIEQMGHLRAAKARLLSGRADLASTVAALENTYENLQALEKARDEAQVNLDVVLQRIKLAQDALAEHSKGLNAIFDLIKPNIEKDSRARVENAMHELYFDATFSTQILKQFVTIPTDVLTLMLVIAMGVLGSSMQVNFATLVKNQTVTISGYVMRLTVGALTALVIFIVAKAGVPVIADTSRFGGDAPINPYLVSFLAIISGLMSENAIASVQAQGTRFFGAGVGGPDRWVRTDMTGDLARENLSLSAIAGHLDVSEASATAKLKGAEKLNPEQQKALALYLRRDPRDLYTDIAPPESPAE